MSRLSRFFRPLSRVEAEVLADIAGVIALFTLAVGVLSLGGW